MTTYEMLFTAGAIGILLYLGLIAVRRSYPGNPAIALALSLTFLIYSLLPVSKLGPLGVLASHTGDFWDVQVWFDLLLAIGTALFLAAPRVRRAGMVLWPWLCLIVATGSIGLLAMLARLFWLERSAMQPG